MIEGVGYGKMNIVGHALGGWVALELAVRSPQAAKTVTLVGSAGIHLRDVPKGDPFFWNPEKVIRHLFEDDRLIDEWIDREKSMTSVQIELRLKNQLALARFPWTPPLYTPHLSNCLHRV